MYLQYLQAFIDLIKGISWPVAATLIAFYFKPELGLLIPRLRRAGPTGVEFDAADQQQEATKITSSPDELEKLPGIGRTPAIERMERTLYEALEGVPAQTREAHLVRLLAQARLETAFEQTYRMIFGSQIHLLKRLNETRNLLEADARLYYEQAKREFSDFYQHYDFNQWLAFLLNGMFVQRDGLQIVITDFGREFLWYVVSKGLPEIKPG